MNVDLNHGSGCVYGGGPRPTAGMMINTAIDAALVRANRANPPRDYLGASRIGEPCPRKLAYEIAHTPKDAGQDFDGTILRIFEAGHRFEDLTVDWLRAAGFDLRTRKRDGGQFGFSVAGGRLRGHIDGVIVDGPDIGLRWPALWEHKALNAKSWADLVKRGLRASKPIYFAQVQIYMGYMEVERTLFTAMNKDSQGLFHEVVLFDAAEAQSLSDKAVDVLRATDTGELPQRIAAAADFYFCRWCEYAKRCWETRS